jgi:hypothetical protein
MSYDYADSALDQRVISLLRADNTRLRQALKFYADEKNYQSRSGTEDLQNSVVDSDNGKIARDALEKK